MGVRILVVDDEEDVRSLIAAYLGKNGLTIDTAEGLSAARALLACNDYALMLLDKNMPGDKGNGEGGIDLLRQVRSQGLSSEVIMMTGFASIETALEAMRLGAFDYLVKPFSLDDLLRKVNRVIEYRQFLNSEYTSAINRGIRKEILELLNNGVSMSYEEMNNALVRLDSSIDRVFEILKEYERILLLQRESLAKIADLSEQVKSSMPGSANAVGFIEEISRESGKRL